MAQKDYLLRMIEMAGEMLVRLRRRLLGGEAEPGEVEATLDRVAGQVGLDLDLLRAASPDTMVLFLSPAGEPEWGRCWISGELFHAEALARELDGDLTGALDGYQRALRCFLLLHPDIVGRGFPDVRERVAELEGRVASLGASGGSWPCA